MNPVGSFLNFYMAFPNDLGYLITDNVKCIFFFMHILNFCILLSTWKQINQYGVFVTHLSIVTASQQILFHQSVHVYGLNLEIFLVLYAFMAELYNCPL